jgi:hypothetical protein
MLTPGACAIALATAFTLSMCGKDEPVAVDGGGTAGSTGGTAGGAGASGGAGLETGGSAGTPAQGTGGTGGAGTGGGAGTTGGSAGSAGSAGSDVGVDGGVTDGAAKRDGGAASCASGQYAICEDFEATEVGAIPSGWTKHGGQAVVASDEAAHGTHALKISPMVSGERRIYASASKIKDAHWGRVFYKVQSPAPVSCDTNTVLHATFVAFQGVGPTVGAGEYRVVDTVENKQGMHQYLYNVQPSGAEFATGGQYKWKFDGQWKCVEWHLDSTNQSFHMYVDGVEDTGVAINNGAGKYSGSEMPSSFSEIKIGINNYQKACEPYLTAWIDDLIVDTNRIGCQ